MSINFHKVRGAELQWLQTILDDAIDGVLVESADRVVYANPAYVALLGYRRAAEIVNRPVSDFVDRDDVDRLSRFTRMRASGVYTPVIYDFYARRKDGSTTRLAASVSLSSVAGKPYITTMVRPFPEAKDELEESVLSGRHDRLSKRERQVMDMLLLGIRPKAIASELGLSEKTIATHRTRILGKLGVADNRELYQYALRHRLIDWV